MIEQKDKQVVSKPLMITERAYDRLKQLAGHNFRTLSGQVECLVDAEWERLTKAEADKAIGKARKQK